MKRRIISLLLALLLLLAALTACNGGEGEVTTEDTEESTDLVGVEVRISEYTLVRSVKASSATSELFLSLKASLKELSGNEIRVANDFSADGSIPSDTKEILLGVTNRPQSEEIAQKIGDRRFYVGIVGSKIVIQAGNEAFLSAAVDYFLASIVSTCKGCIYLPEMLGHTSDEVEAITLVEDGAAKYDIVYRDGATDAMTKVLDGFKSNVNGLSGASFFASSDRKSPSAVYNSKTPEILIGDTRYDETAEGMELLRADEYGIIKVGSKLLVLGRTRASSVKALEKLLSAMRSGTTEKDGKKTVVLYYAGPMIYKNTEYFTDIPEYNAGKLTGAYDSGDGTLCGYYEAADGSGYESYASALLASGFSEISAHTIGECRYSSYKKGEGRVYLSYLKSTGTLRIITEKRDHDIQSAENEEKLCEVTLTAVGLSYTSDETNGMSYLLRLADGSFVIFDGGFERDSEHLYELLCAQNVRGGKPYIRAWILTHMHSDHAGCMKRFSRDHAGDVEVGYFLTNIADNYYDPDQNNDKYDAEMARFSGAKRQKLHAGDKLLWPGVELEVLYTHEELYPNSLDIAFGNETSVVTRLNVNGQSVLIMGDVQDEASDKLVAMYKEALRSDVCQIAHHGSKNHPATKEIYSMILPSVALFPGSQTRYSENKGTPENKYIIDTLGAKIYVADGGDRVFTFPIS